MQAGFFYDSGSCTIERVAPTPTYSTEMFPHVVEQPPLVPPWKALRYVIPPDGIDVISVTTAYANIPLRFDHTPPTFAHTWRRDRRLAPYGWDGSDVLRWKNLGPDTLRFYLSGAASDGGAQTNPDSSLGNYRSSTEAVRVGVLQSTAIPGLDITLAGRRSLGDDTIGIISSDGADAITFFTSDAAEAGSTLTIMNGETKIIQDGDTPSRFLRVTRSSADPLEGFATLRFHDQYGNVWGMSDSSSAVAATQYRGPFIKSHGDVNSIYLRLNELATSAVSSVTQLAGAGAGTIVGAANCFINWPHVGYARVEDSGGTEKEVVYYSSRTSTTLTVPAGGRGLLGTSATAGAGTDVIRSVPGIAIGYENASPLAGGAIQTIADEYTAPTGITWKRGTTNAGGIGPLALKDGEQVGLWIRRATPTASIGHSKHYVSIACEFVTGATTFTEHLGGLWRYQKAAEERYELHVGTNAEPDLTAAPTETFTSFPYTTSMSFTAGNTYYLVTNKRNQYGLVTQNSRTTVLPIDGGGLETYPVPTSPDGIMFEAYEAGAFRLRAVYYDSADMELSAAGVLTDWRADYWAIYLRTNGTDPDPSVDSPTLVPMDGVYHLDYTTATFANGTDGRVILKVHRSSDTAESADETIFQDTANTVAPNTPTGGAFLDGVAEVL